MDDKIIGFDPHATREAERVDSGDGSRTTKFVDSSDTGRQSGGLEVRCPNCHAPIHLPPSSALSGLTCSACGSEFSLINESDATRLAAPLASLGRFELVARLGMGSFGSVWKARDKELDRTVAIKIPRQGSLSAGEQDQFFREARAAAQLRHPNIVSVYEVGRDGDNVYIVSDFVRGVTLGDWLTGQQPTSRDAVELCAKIADALHHAHEQGVVHRDLKPANIMIDAEGNPHLMDFGLARGEVGEVTVTMDGQIMGTPAYMSPEQAQGESHTADSRSDVYSLGVILFELLTGERPFRGNVRMLMHQVINDEPPSSRQFSGNLPKDLEIVTLKCLEKEPGKRYETAKDFSDELQRYLRGEPIRARAVGRLTRAFRWSKRKPAAAALLALLVFAAAGFAAAFLRERDMRQEIIARTNEIGRQKAEAEHEKTEAEHQKSEAVRQRAIAESSKSEAESQRDSAKAIVDFLTNDVLTKASPMYLQDKTLRDAIVTLIIEPAGVGIAKRFSGKPMVEAQVRYTLGRTLLSLGRADLALPHSQIVLELRRKVLGENHPDTILALSNHGQVLLSLGRVQEAEPLYKQALEQSRKLLGENHPDTIASLNNYGRMLELLGRAQDAELLFKQALDRDRKVLGEGHPDTIRSRRNYARVPKSLGRTNEAEPLFKQVLEQSRKILGEDNWETISSLDDYAAILNTIGRAQEAEPLYKQVLDRRRKVIGEDHPATILSLTTYAFVLNSLGRTHEAEPLFKQAMEQSRKVFGEYHPDTINSLTTYALVLNSLGRTHEAEPLAKQALEQNRKVFGENHANTISARSNYAFVLESLGRVQEAEPFLKQALEQNRKVLGENDPNTILSLSQYATVLNSLGLRASLG